MKTILSWATAFTIIGWGAGNAQSVGNASPGSPDLPAVLKGGTIGYVLTERHWAVYETPGGKVECPSGFNDGPREQYKQLFPDDGKKRTLLETELAREGDQWFPTNDPEPFAFKEILGKVSYGMNLDGNVKDGDFTSPDGEKGIDNQLYRALGCISSYRGPDGAIYQSDLEYLPRFNHNRFMIEISGVDSLVNDDEVTVRSYRGLDNLLADATGYAFIPGGTQHVDERWGKSAQSIWKGKIVDGVLITGPADLTLPASATFNTSATQKLKGYRFRLRLTPQGAQGLMAGYVDVEQFDRYLNTSWSTHLQSYGQLSSASLYRALRRLADGYPDPETGEMTAISSAIEVKFTQAYIVHPPARTAETHPTHGKSQFSR
jgi:hypothetical protein